MEALRETTANWRALVAQIGPHLAARAVDHDARGTFVEENYSLLKEHRFFSLCVPAELGGGGAGHAETCEVVRELAHFCPATALSFSMHTHVVAAAVWRWRNGKPAETLLRRVAAQQLVLVSTGGTDWVESSGELTRVEGGYRLNAIKPFTSGSPGADIMATSARFGDRVLHFSVPYTAEGVTVLEDWDTLGMRGTGSNTTKLEDVFVPDEAVLLDRSGGGEWNPSWTVSIVIALPIFMAAYVGAAERAAELACADALPKARAPWLPYLLGELENELTSARLAWRDMIRIADEYEFLPVVELADATLVRKTLCAKAAIATVEKAMEVSGGRGFFQSHDLQRLLRDVHAAPYHPLPEKRQLLFTGRLALGLEPAKD